MDDAIGRLLESLDLDRTLVVAVADHGESLGRHGEPTHSVFCYDATLRVPEGMTALMSAVNGTEPAEDGAWRFRMPQPIPSYLLALAVGEVAFRPLGERTGVWAELPVLERAAHEFAETEAMLRIAGGPERRLHLRHGIAADLQRPLVGADALFAGQCTLRRGRRDRVVAGPRHTFAAGHLLLQFSQLALPTLQGGNADVEASEGGDSHGADSGQRAVTCSSVSNTDCATCRALAAAW